MLNLWLLKCLHIRMWYYHKDVSVLPFSEHQNICPIFIAFIIFKKILYFQIRKIKFSPIIGGLQFHCYCLVFKYFKCLHMQWRVGWCQGLLKSWTSLLLSSTSKGHLQSSAWTLNAFLLNIFLFPLTVSRPLAEVLGKKKSTEMSSFSSSFCTW